MGLARCLLLLAALAWIAGLAVATGAALRECQFPLRQNRPARIRTGAIALLAHYANQRLPVCWRVEQMTRLLRAGAGQRWSPPEWCALRCSSAAAAGCLCALVALRWPAAAVLALLPAAVVGWWMPDAWLRIRTCRRQRRIRADLMPHFELLLAGLEAGLPLRDALRLTIEYGLPGPLVATLAGTLQDSAAGCEPDEVLRRLRRRLQSPAADAVIGPLLGVGSAGAGLPRAVRATITRHVCADLAHAERRARRAPRWALGLAVSCFAPALVVAVTIPAAVHWIGRL